MADYTPIFTNNALAKMKGWGLSESDVKDAYYKGQAGKSLIPGTQQVVKKYNGYEIGVIYKRESSGQYVIISVWKRTNRR